MQIEAYSASSLGISFIKCQSHDKGCKSLWKVYILTRLHFYKIPHEHTAVACEDRANRIETWGDRESKFLMLALG